jgi:hypothetical protein
MLVLASCNSLVKKNKVIDTDTFADVLTAIHLADATLAVSGLKVNKDTTTIEQYYNSVLIKYGVTQKQIEESFAYYATKPHQFEKIYEAVSENLAKMESEYEEKNNQKEEEISSPDK